MKNADPNVINDFGHEWTRFSQDGIEQELLETFQRYFRIFPLDRFTPESVVADFGCGSGRWAKFVAPCVKTLYLVEPSRSALDIACTNLKNHTNLIPLCSTINDCAIEDGTLDFAYCLGVLHHIPDTESAFAKISSKIRVGGYLLVYMYYNFENRPLWFRYLWRAVDMLRKIISKMPFRLKALTADMLAALVYAPVVAAGSLLKKIGALPQAFPLRDYIGKSFYTMRTDALDRFGTRIEKRYSRQDIKLFYEKNGFDISTLVISDTPPYWCAVGRRA
jgi:SAM-dependent methyltransferase